MEKFPVCCSAVQLCRNSQVSLEVGKVYIPEPKNFPAYVADQKNQNGGQNVTGPAHVAEQMDQDGGQESAVSDEKAPNTGREEAEGKNQNGGQEDEARKENNAKDSSEMNDSLEKLKTKKEEETEERRKKEDTLEGKTKEEEETVVRKKKEEEEIEERKKKEEDCGEPCKFCLFLVSGHTKIILAFKDKATLMVSFTWTGFALSSSLAF